jgi:hypothetical protein
VLAATLAAALAAVLAAALAGADEAAADELSLLELLPPHAARSSAALIAGTAIRIWRLRMFSPYLPVGSYSPVEHL